MKATIFQYLSLLKRHYWILVVCTLFGFTIGLVIAKTFQRPTYTAYSAISVTNKYKQKLNAAEKKQRDIEAVKTSAVIVKQPMVLQLALLLAIVKTQAKPTLQKCITQTATSSQVTWLSLSVTTK